MSDHRMTGYRGRATCGRLPVDRRTRLVVNLPVRQRSLPRFADNGIESVPQTGETNLQGAHLRKIAGT